MSAPFVSPPIEKGPPRPAPTQAYTFREYNPNATLYYIRNHEHANKVLAKLSRQTVFGFDLEWKPTFQRAAKENPVALVQLANDDNIILFQITAMKSKYISSSYGVGITFSSQNFHRGSLRS
jgi:hypothetical protein